MGAGIAYFRFRRSTEVKVIFTEEKPRSTEVKRRFTEVKRRSTEVKPPAPGQRPGERGKKNLRAARATSKFQNFHSFSTRFQKENTDFR